MVYNDNAERNSMATHFMIIACASLMAGYTRMTYSLGIILMETSQAIEVFVPMIITIGIANQVGSLFTRSLYERSARGKQMPILKDRVPKQCEHITAQKIMSKNLNTLLNVDTVQNVLEAINSGHHGFPVLNHLGNVVGLIPRNFIVTLLENRGFYMTRRLKKFKQEGEGILLDGSTEPRQKESSQFEMVSPRPTAEHTPSEGRKQESAIDFDHQGTLSRFSNLVDDDLFPRMPKPLILAWPLFVRDFHSRDKELTQESREVCEQYLDHMVDFRPYLINNPIQVFTTDRIGKCLRIFRYMQCRTVLVMHPKDAKLKGVITRQDVFKYMDL